MSYITQARPTTRVLVDGDKQYELMFTRRRYSNATFTWVDVKVDGEWVSIGDPWQCVTPKKSEMLESIRLTLANR